MKLARATPFQVRLSTMALAAVAAGLAACGQPTPTPAASGPSPQMRLTVGYSPWPGNFPMLVAKEKGFYENHGLEVNCVLQQDSQQELADFVAKNYDAAGLALGSIALIAAREADAAFILVSDRSDGADVVMARPGIESARDLKGKRLGVLLGGFGELFVLEMLEQAGVSPEDVTMKAMDGNEVPRMLEKGEIDAGQTWEPFASESRRTANAHPIYTSRTSDLILDGFVFHRSTLKDKPEAVRAFVKGWYEGVAYCLAHPDETTSLLTRVLGKPPDEVSFEGMKLYGQAENLKTFGAPEDPASVHAVFRRFAEFYVRKGNVNVTAQPGKALDGSFL